MEAYDESRRYIHVYIYINTLKDTYTFAPG